MTRLADLLTKHFDDEPAGAPPPVERRRVREEDDETELEAQLESNTVLALKFHRQLLELGPQFDSPKLLAAQNVAASAVLNAQVRVDEGRLKKRKLDVLPKLLERIQAEEAKRAAITLLAG